MKNQVRIYKNTIDQSIIKRSMEMFELYPNEILTQSVCTDTPVLQLREFLPVPVAKAVLMAHNTILPKITRDFELEKDDIKLEKPNYLETYGQEMLTVDKRIEGMWLGTHRDIPTGTYTKHFGLEGGMTAITMSCVFYWNDDFEGGELKFIDPTLEQANEMSEQDLNNPYVLKPPYVYKPVAGDMVVFPSHIYHNIEPVKSGSRYSTQYFFNRDHQYHVDELPNNHLQY
jgi:hypothetical protein